MYVTLEWYKCEGTQMMNVRQFRAWMKAVGNGMAQVHVLEHKADSTGLVACGVFSQPDSRFRLEITGYPRHLSARDVDKIVRHYLVHGKLITL